MHAYMDNLAKLLEGTAVQRSQGPEITVKLVPLNEKDDVEAYLVTFRRIMEAHNILEDRWPHYLTSQLMGKAQLLFLLQIVGITRKLKRQFSSGMGLTRKNTGGDFGWRGERTGRRTES